MAPTPQENVPIETQTDSKSLNGEEIVISGMSGVFPKSKSILEFCENLYNKVDMVTGDNNRWVFDHPEVPKHMGMVEGMNEFDAQFFRVHYKQACVMEPMSRKLLEHAFSAIFDAGINPLTLKGKRIGVFIGTTFSETEKILVYDSVKRHGFGITGACKSMLANRISYWLDVTGPSFCLDAFCGASAECLEIAYNSVKNGYCDAAIVGGSKFSMHPIINLNFRRLGYICMDGKTKCYDRNGDGYARADAINVIYIQKAKDAKRIYSEVYHVKSLFNPEVVDKFLPTRDTKCVENLLSDFYSDIDVKPEDVEYIEGSGAAIADVDEAELKVIEKFFGKNKTIKLGCVKSNMGNSEPASALCSIIKLCLAYQKGKIPGNLHYQQPFDTIPAIKDGKIEILDENSPFERGYAAINTISFHGNNIHTLIKGHYIPKDPERYKSCIPRLVLLSGRQEACVQHIFETLKKQPLDPEQIALIHEIFQTEIPPYLCRGYLLLDTNEKNETVALSESIEYYPGTTGPVWFLYSGMGSQWAGMGTELMKIPTFAAAIERCRRVLEPKGVDLVRILTDPDKTIYDNILHSFVGIAAIQIGLTDLLNEMGIVPDNVIGHSVGELGCAYADNCFTAEEMILCAYSRGLVSVETEFIKGSMAAVGLGYEDIFPMCPPEIDVACHNSSESSTISGPADIMKGFVAELTSKGIFAQEVKCSNIAYHSRYIQQAGPALLKYLTQVVPTPKKRSNKWVSTSVPRENWEDPDALYSSAEYHTNNLLNSVLFEETAKMIPHNAVVIEIAPHGLLQAIIKRSMKDCIHVPLTRRAHSKPLKFLLDSVGKLYQAGLNPKIDFIYPKVAFPVSTETSLLSHLIQWEHSEKWPEARFSTKDMRTNTIRNMVLSVYDQDYEYFDGYLRNGVTVLPEASLLVTVWETYAMIKGVMYTDLSVIFKEVECHGEICIKKDVTQRYSITIHRGNNKFEVTYEDTPIVKGYIYDTKTDNIVFKLNEDTKFKEEDIVQNSEDIYKILHFRGLSFNEVFRGLKKSTLNRSLSLVKWSDDWVIFLDNLLQINLIATDFNGISAPKIIKKINIDVNMHKIDIDKSDNKELIAYFNNKTGVIRCGGVEVDSVSLEQKIITENCDSYLKCKYFVPHFLSGDISLETALQIYLQLVNENIQNEHIEVKLFDVISEFNIKPTILSIAAKDPYISCTIKDIETKTKSYDDVTKNDFSNANFVIVQNMFGFSKKMQNLYQLVPENAFVLSLEEKNIITHKKEQIFNVVSAVTIENKLLILLSKSFAQKNDFTCIPIRHDNSFTWVSQLKQQLDKKNKTVLISEKQPFCGLIGMVKNLRKSYGSKVSLVVVDDYQAASFDQNKEIFYEQLQKNLAINVFKKGQWGGYYYMPNNASTQLRNIILSCSVPGNMDSLTWLEHQLPSTNTSLVQVHYAGLSYRDAEKATGKIPNMENSFGMDFSGLNSKGERVMGLVHKDAVASTVIPDPDLMWPVPEHWSLEDAATVPLPYIHAYYCLTIRAQLQHGCTVFVNGGAGTLAQAVISICLARDCTVYTTVSDTQKKKFLLKLFPKLKEHNIGPSRNEAFQNMLIENSINRRCDIVINCGAGETRRAAMKCVGPYGLFLDLCTHDMSENEEFGTFFLNHERSYEGVNMSSIYYPENLPHKKELRNILAEGIANGTVRPLSRVVYSPANVSRGFRLLALSRHRGRVLLNMKDPEVSKQNLSITPTNSYSPTGYYVIVSDDSDLGVELVDRLIRNGARNIVLHKNSESVSGYFGAKFRLWRELGALVTVISKNLQIESNCVNILKEISKRGTVESFFIIQDNTLDEQCNVMNEKIFSSKFKGSSLVAINLDLVSRRLCPELKHFVLLTRGSKSIVDNYADSASEKLCQLRNDTGLPALYFHVELLNEFARDVNNSSTKLQPQSVSAALDALETSLKLNLNNVSSYSLKKQSDGDFLSKVEKVLGLRNINELDENLTMNDLILNEINVEEIKNIIYKNHHVHYPNETIKRMTINTLKSLQQILSVRKTNFDAGLGAFYRDIGEDECLAAEPVMKLPTQLGFTISEEEQESDSKSVHLFIIPGFEGYRGNYTNISERLKIPAVAIQYGPDLAYDSIEQIAFKVMDSIKKRFELRSKVHLLGYSFGVNVALEVARLVEKEGLPCVVNCLDSSPDALRTHLNAYLGDLSEVQLQNSIIMHIFKLMSNQEGDDLKSEIENKEVWEDKVAICVKRLSRHVSFSNEYKRTIIYSLYNRIKMSMEYKPNFKLESELVLMKGIPHPNAKDLTNDYNLSKYTTKPIKIFTLDRDHALAREDCRVSDVVNRYLEPEILEEFKKKNLCDTYHPSFNPLSQSHSSNAP